MTLTRLLESEANPFWLGRYGAHTERSLYDHAAGLVDGVVLQANLIEGTPGAVLSALRQWWSGSEQIGFAPFVIDPVTYVLTGSQAAIRSPATGGVKRTYERLLNEYGAVAVEGLETPIPINTLATPSGLTDAGELLTNSVARYQRNVLINFGEDSDELEPGLLEQIRPAFTIAPYFMSTANSTKWSRISSLTADFLKRENPSEIVAGIAAIHRQTLMNRERLDEVSRQFSESSADAVIVWVNNTVEHSYSEEELQNLRELTAALKAASKQVVGYASGPLGLALGWDGNIHPLGYGDLKNADAETGGGAPFSRFYFPPFRQLLPSLDALALVSGMTKDQYLADVCQCEVCQNVIVDPVGESFKLVFVERESRVNPSGRPYEFQTAQSIFASRLHFALNRRSEVDRAVAVGATGFKQMLQDDYDRLFPLYGYRMEHIQRWAAI